MKKRLLALLLAGLMAFVFAACSNTNENNATTDEAATTENTETADSANSDDPLSVELDGSGIKVGFVTKDLASQYWNLVKAGADAAAAKYGCELNFIAPNSESDVQKQVENIETLISAGVDVICIAPSNDETVLPALNNAVNAGIKVIAVDTDSSLPEKVSFIGTGNEAAAKQGAEWAAQKVGSGSKAIILRGRMGDQTHDMREAGIKAGLEENGVEILEIQAADSDQAKALQITENLLQKYPDLSLIIATADPMAVGAYNAVKFANVDTVSVYGFNGDEDVVHAVLEGGQMIGTTAQSPYNMGVMGVQNAICVMQGETIEEVIDSGSSVINAENGQAFLDELSALTK